MSTNSPRWRNTNSKDSTINIDDTKYRNTINTDSTINTNNTDNIGMFSSCGSVVSINNVK